MKETCYYCYYNTRCAKLPYFDENGWCSDWAPFVVPRRLINNLAEEFYTSACASAAHIYDDVVRVYVQKVVYQYTAAITEQLSAAYEERLLLEVGDPERRRVAHLAYKNRGRK